MAFDAAAFGLPAPEAALMDPQQRLLLEAAAEALWAGAGGAGGLAAAGGALGVYVGIASSDYGSVVKAHTAAGAYHATANAPSVAAGRLAFAFGLRGPAVAVDTACSASLVALHLARAALTGGGGAALGGALAAGVHVQAAPTSSLYVAAAAMLSPSGRCRVLDAAADGYVRGEAVHALLLQALPGAGAGAAGAGAGAPRPLALLAGSAVNQDGRSSGLTAPNGPAQTGVIRGALADAGFAPGALHLLSMHGTGTALGDPVEVNAAAAALLPPAGAAAGAAPPLALLASKSWHGHTEPDAGLVALAHAASAAAAAARHPILHLRGLNPYVAGVLAPLARAGGARAAAARQAAPLPVGAAAGRGEGVVFGTSAFAFMVRSARAALQCVGAVLASPCSRTTRSRPPMRARPPPAAGHQRARDRVDAPDRGARRGRGRARAAPFVAPRAPLRRARAAPAGGSSRGGGRRRRRDLRPAPRRAAARAPVGPPRRRRRGVSGRGVP